MMETLRNMTIRHALDHGYDYWFSVDTDLVLHPDTLRYLLEADKDIVSEIFWSTSKDIHYWCNAWMYDQGSGMPDEWHNPGLYQVGMTGACTLVKRHVLESGVDYTHIPNIQRALYGEDRHFCVRAAVHGFELWVDTHCPAIHLYTETEYQKYMNRKGRR
jgi:GT2 family glycosyltransferase